MRMTTILCLDVLAWAFDRLYFWGYQPYALRCHWRTANELESRTMQCSSPNIDLWALIGEFTSSVCLSSHKSRSCDLVQVARHIANASRSFNAATAHTESFFSIKGKSLDSLSISSVTAATRQYLCPSADASKAARSQCIIPCWRSPFRRRWLIYFLLLPYKQGNLDLWWGVRIDDVRAWMYRFSLLLSLRLAAPLYSSVSMFWTITTLPDSTKYIEGAIHDNLKAWFAKNLAVTSVKQKTTTITNTSSPKNSLLTHHPSQKHHIFNSGTIISRNYNCRK